MHPALTKFCRLKLVFFRFEMHEQNATPKSTSASRMQKMRKKLTLTDSDYQKPENKRIANLKAQKKDKMSEKEKCALRQYERDRKRLQRAKKKKNVQQALKMKVHPVLLTQLRQHFLKLCGK